jgi:hypothetical protein
MIIGAHTIVYSTNPDADRAFLRDVLELGNIDLGGGWLIFGLPPSELAVHPSRESGAIEFYLMCEDVQAFIAKMDAHGIACERVHEERWGLLTQIRLPGGGPLRVYQPLHARPPVAVEHVSAKKPVAKKPAKKRARKVAKKKAAKAAPKRKTKKR